MLLLNAAPASAGEAPFAFGTTESVLAGEPVILLVYAYTELSAVEASVERLSDKKRWTFEHGEMSSGDEWECEWEQKAARASYRIHVEAQLADGSSHEHSAEFEVLLVQSLSVELDFERTDLDAGHVALSASAGLARFEMQAFDERKSLLVEQARALDGSKELELSWEPTQESPVYVRISVYDDNDIGVELELFSFDVPHENVVFDSNQSTLRDDQVHKLDATLATIQGALAKYDEVALELYVGGYTDTVGSAADNISLSSERAKTLAEWFRKKLSIPIYYQGFGEDVLELQTGDNVDEERNRRAVYLLSNTQPAASRDFPRSSWKATH